MMGRCGKGETDKKGHKQTEGGNIRTIIDYREYTIKRELVSGRAGPNRGTMTKKDFVGGRFFLALERQV